MSYSWDSWRVSDGLEGRPMPLVHIKKSRTERVKDNKKRYNDENLSYFVRYISGESLIRDSYHFSKENLEDSFREWLKEIQEGLNNSPDEEKRIFLVRDLARLIQVSRSIEGLSILIDQANRQGKKSEERQQLKRIYKDSFDKDLRQSAGRALGYSRMRLWFRKNL